MNKERLSLSESENKNIRQHRKILLTVLGLTIGFMLGPQIEGLSEATNFSVFELRNLFLLSFMLIYGTVIGVQRLKNKYVKKKLGN